MLKWSGGTFCNGKRAWKLFLLSWLQGRVLSLDGVLRHAFVCRFRANTASVLSSLKCALQQGGGEFVLLHVSIHVDFGKMYVCLQVNDSWKSEAHGKRVRSWLAVDISLILKSCRIHHQMNTECFSGKHFLSRECCCQRRGIEEKFNGWCTH